MKFFKVQLLMSFFPCASLSAWDFDLTLDQNASADLDSKWRKQSSGPAQSAVRSGDEE